MSPPKLDSLKSILMLVRGIDLVFDVLMRGLRPDNTYWVILIWGISFIALHYSTDDSNFFLESIVLGSLGFLLVCFETSVLLLRKDESENRPKYLTEDLLVAKSREGRWSVGLLVTAVYLFDLWVVDKKEPFGDLLIWVVTAALVVISLDFFLIQWRIRTLRYGDNVIEALEVLEEALSRDRGGNSGDRRRKLVFQIGSGVNAGATDWDTAPSRETSPGSPK